MESFFDDDEEFDIAAIEARHTSMETEAILKASSDETAEDELCGAYPVEDWEAIIEAVLFTMGNSVELRQLAVAIDQAEEVAKQVVEHLQQRYEKENRGMQIIALEDSYQMTTRAKHYENLIRVAVAPKKHVLTEVMLETLSIIAYKQPVTKVEISRIRGVSSDHAVNRLVEYGLVGEVGRLDAPGRPILFATTEEFLRRFGVTSTLDLPSINPEQEEEIAQEVEEELKLHLGEEALGETSEGEEPWKGMSDGEEPWKELSDGEKADIGTVIQHSIDTEPEAENEGENEKDDQD